MSASSKMDGLKGEVAGKQQLLEEAESSRTETQKKTALLSWRTEAFMPNGTMFGQRLKLRKPGSMRGLAN